MSRSSLRCAAGKCIVHMERNMCLSDITTGQFMEVIDYEKSYYWRAWRASPVGM